MTLTRVRLYWRRPCKARDGFSTSTRRLFASCARGIKRTAQLERTSQRGSASMSSRERRNWFRHISLTLGIVCIGWEMLAASASAAPQIANLSLRGLQIGAATTLTVDGTDLLPEPHVLLPVPIASQVLKKEGATPNRIQIEVTLSPTIGPGLYQLRIANPKGISNPVLIGIDDLAQVPFSTQVS